MFNTITSKLNFTFTKLKNGDSKFRITKIHSDNDKYNDLSFGNKFDIMTKIDILAKYPNLNITFTIIDEIDDKLIMSYNQNIIHTIDVFGVNYTKQLTKYHTFNKNEFLKQLFYLKSSQSS